MIRIGAGIAVCAFGLVLAGCAAYFGWVHDTPDLQPVADQLYRNFAMMFAVFAAVFTAGGAIYILRSVRRMRLQDRQRARRPAMHG